MDSSDEESSESSSSDESPAVKKPELKTTGSKEKPSTTVKVQNTKTLSLLLLANLGKVPVPAPAPKNDSTVGFIKRFKASTYHHYIQLASLLPTKPKEEVFQNF